MKNKLVFGYVSLIHWIFVSAAAFIFLSSFYAENVLAQLSLSILGCGISSGSYVALEHFYRLIEVRKDE